jgi:excisionase family DNA binding protein
VAGLERLVELKEAGAVLGVHERTLRAWAAAGKFPVVRLSRRCLRVRLSDLEAFVESRTVAASHGRPQRSFP